MKIIMPIAGKGTRLRPHTHVIPKSLIRVAGKPIIDYIIDQLEGIEFSEIIFIIGHLGEQMKTYLQNRYKFPMKFIRQVNYHGLGHAIDHARSEFDTNEPVLILLGDIIFTADFKKIVGNKTNMLGVMEVDDPRRFGVVEIDKEGIIKKMVEKPEDPPSNLAIAGIYYFHSASILFNSLQHIITNKIKTREEYQLTDAMIHMMQTGEQFKTFNVPEWYDCGEKQSLLDTNQVMLKRYATNDKITGNIIIPPVYIGKNTLIENSIIGPNVSISEGSTVKDAIVKDSILGVETTVEKTIIANSLIGDNSTLVGEYREFNIGPDSEIVFHK